MSKIVWQCKIYKSLLGIKGLIEDWTPFFYLFILKYHTIFPWLNTNKCQVSNTDSQQDPQGIYTRVIVSFRYNCN